MTASKGHLKARRLLMLGFGITGKAICEFALKHSLFVAVSEYGRLTLEQQSWLDERGILYEQSGHTSAYLSQVDTVIVSPGVPANAPILEWARDRGLVVISETDFALRFVAMCPVIAVTGTNGKSSTVEVIAAILNSQGCRARVAGNIGIPLIALVDDVAPDDTLVLELSSYQLEQSDGFRPNVGVLLTFSPDHLQRHGTLKAYAEAKGNLFAGQKPDDAAILPRLLASQFAQGRGRRVFYDEAFRELPAGTESLLPHERSNLRAALAACQARLPDLDITSIPMHEVCSTFRLPHRMETLGFVRSVRIINDSKSTNAGSTIAALKSITEPTVLLLGGRSKGVGYEALVSACEAARLREIILFGEAAEELKQVFAQSPFEGFTVTVATSMEMAIDRGLCVAQENDTLLLSPACSSFDAFSDYVDRGQTFAQLIRSKSGFHSELPRT